MRRLLVAVCAASLCLGCGGASEDKGAEENELTGGKEDSFFSPTEHGELQMGSVENIASLTRDQGFHAWTFKLGDEAKLDIHTKAGRNLDTVMYLYHRTDSLASCGRYAKKNDDDGDLLTSRITHNGAAGEYRIIVKGFKAAMTGNFSVLATCDGPGCNAAPACDADTFAAMPRSEPFTADCAFELGGLMRSDVVSQNRTEVALGDRCRLGAMERKAVETYHEYWDDLAGFDDLFRFDPDEDVQLGVSILEFRGGGHEITVDAGGDEDALSMFFNSAGDLLAAYQHNQSPTIDYYCPAGTSAPIEGPDEDCFAGLMHSIPAFERSDLESGEVSVADSGDAALHPSIGPAVTRFAEGAGLDAGEVVSWELTTWDSVNEESGAAVNLMGPDDVSAEYTLRVGDDGWEVVMEADANGISFVCD